MLESLLLNSSVSPEFVQVPVALFAMEQVSRHGWHMQDVWHVPVDDQLLFCGHQELSVSDDFSMQDLILLEGVREDGLLLVTSTPAMPHFQVFVKKSENKIPIMVNADELALAVKVRIEVRGPELLHT